MVALGRGALGREPEVTRGRSGVVPRQPRRTQSPIHACTLREAASTLSAAGIRRDPAGRWSGPTSISPHSGRTDRQPAARRRWHADDVGDAGAVRRASVPREPASSTCTIAELACGGHNVWILPGIGVTAGLDAHGLDLRLQRTRARDRARSPCAACRIRRRKRSSPVKSAAALCQRNARRRGVPRRSQRPSRPRGDRRSATTAVLRPRYEMLYSTRHLDQGRPSAYLGVVRAPHEVVPDGGCVCGPGFPEGWWALAAGRTTHRTRCSTAWNPGRAGRASTTEATSGCADRGPARPVRSESSSSTLQAYLDSLPTKMFEYFAAGIPS